MRGRGEERASIQSDRTVRLEARVNSQDLTSEKKVVRREACCPVQ